MMLTDKQRVLKRELEREIYQIDVLISECNERKYSDSIIKMLISAKILKRERLGDINLYDR